MGRRRGEEEDDEEEEEESVCVFPLVYNDDDKRVLGIFIVIGREGR